MGYRQSASKRWHPLFKNECYRPYGLSSQELRIQLALGSIDLYEVSHACMRKSNTSSKILNVLADSKEPGIRYLVSIHPNTSRSTRLRMRRQDALESPNSKRDRRKGFRW